MEKHVTQETTNMKRFYLIMEVTFVMMLMHLIIFSAFKLHYKLNYITKLNIIGIDIVHDLLTPIFVLTSTSTILLHKLFKIYRLFLRWKHDKMKKISTQSSIEIC